MLLLLPPGIGQQADKARRQCDQRAGSGHGRDARSDTPAEIGQHDRQVVDVHRAAAGELALAQPVPV